MKPHKEPGRLTSSQEEAEGARSAVDACGLSVICLEGACNALVAAALTNRWLHGARAARHMVESAGGAA